MIKDILKHGSHFFDGTQRENSAAIVCRNALYIEGNILHRLLLVVCAAFNNEHLAKVIIQEAVGA